MQELPLAAAFFVGTHLGLPSSPFREALVEKLGERGYRLLFSALAIVALAWLVASFARAPEIVLWTAPGWLRGLVILVMPLACLLFLCAVTSPYPMAAGRPPETDAADPVRGIQRVTRHPLLWSILLWAAGHMLAAGDLAALLFFGALLLVAALGSFLADRRRLRRGGAGWGIYFQITSNLPFQAILQGRQRWLPREIGAVRLAAALGLYLLLLLAHGRLFGPSLFG